MKVRYESEPLHRQTVAKVKEPARKLEVVSVRVGHTASEFHIRLDEVTIVLPPQAAARLLGDLKRVLEDHERQYGEVRAPAEKDARRSRESVPKKVIRELYRSRKVSGKLISVNTKRRKHRKDRDD